MHNKITRIVTELQAISQIGLTFCNDTFDHERYSRIMEISAELASLHSSKSSCEILEIFSKDKGYITPKIGVKAAIFKSNQILLVREKSDGLWSLPGGWADVNLSPKENMLREIREETGFECSIIKLIYVCNKRKDPALSKWPYIYDLFFLCSIIGGKEKKQRLRLVIYNSFLKKIYLLYLLIELIIYKLKSVLVIIPLFYFLLNLTSRPYVFKEGVGNIFIEELLLLHRIKFV